MEGHVWDSWKCACGSFFLEVLGFKQESGNLWVGGNVVGNVVVTWLPITKPFMMAIKP